MKRYKLTDDEQSELTSLMDHSGVKVLFKYLSNLVMEQYENVIRLNMNSQEERRLLYDKLKADGAKDLVEKFQQSYKKSLDRVNSR